MLFSQSDFRGLMPADTESTLPDTYATTAKNVDLSRSYLTPVRAPTAVFSSVSSTAKYVYTIDGFSFLAAEKPLRAFQSPVTQDVYERIYYTEGNKLRVTTKGSLTVSGTGIAKSYIPGVPIPTVAIQVDKVRKNRLPNFPEAVLKGKFFLESNGQRYYETNVTITQKPGSKPFTSYIFDSGINVKDITKKAATTADKKYPLEDNNYYTITNFYLNDDVIIDSVLYAKNVWHAAIGTAYVTSSSITIHYEDGTKILTFDRSKVTYLKRDDTIYTTSSANNTEISGDAVPALELWMQSSPTEEERIWTVFVNTVTAGVISTVPGGVTVTLKPTSNTEYEIVFTFGVIEDRAYVYTMINEWNEESAPSSPVNIPVTYVDDVILRVDVDKCISLFKDKYGDLIYCPFKTLQFYCAGKTGTYQAIATSPTGLTVQNSISITDLYHAILGRDPDTEGLAYWQAMYDAGMSITDIAAAFMQSKEYKHFESGYIIDELYDGLFDREPDAIGYMYHITRYESGVSLREIVVDFITGTEFANKHPTLVNNTTAAFVNFVYNQFLNRNADSLILDLWQQKAPSDWVYWASYVIAMVMTSEEYKAIITQSRVIDVLTVAYGRAPTSEEIAAAVEKLQSGYTLPSLLIKESSITSDGFFDEGVRLGWELQTADWNPPPGDLQSLTLLPNGVFAAVRKTEVWFSEPYLPHTWPTKYIQNVSNEVIATIPFSNNLLLVTSDKPIVVSGPEPGAMTQMVVNISAPGISQTATIAIDGKPVYATKDGLFMMDGMQGSYSLSSQFWTPQKWNELYGNKLSSLALEYYDNKLIGIFPDNNGFIIFFNREKPNLIEFDDRGFSFFRIPGDTNLYMVGDEVILRLFSNDKKQSEWKSKTYILNKPTTLTACCIFYRGKFDFAYFVNSVEAHTKSFNNTNMDLNKVLFRLPAGNKTHTFSFSISSEDDYIIEKIQFASTMLELANA